MCTMFLPELMSFVAAILFSVHPIHTEAVKYCSIPTSGYHPSSPPPVPIYPPSLSLKLYIEMFCALYVGGCIYYLPAARK